MLSNKERQELYRQAGLHLLGHLDKKITADHGYPDQPSWGYAFTALAALNGKSERFDKLFRKAMDNLVKQDKSSKNYSWEFVVYAMLNSDKLIKDENVKKLSAYREKGTRMFNWFLLRNVNKAMGQRFTLIDKTKLKLAKRLYTTKQGLVLDEFRTRSLQYHAFSLFLIAELCELLPGEKWLQDWLIKGASLSSDLLLEDGVALYIGRGQEQIFGYGSLVYVLEKVNQQYQALSEQKLNWLAKRVLSFQRDDGSFPLVLRKIQPEEPEVSFKSDRPAGWYGYNTLYDYQPFLAYCLLKTANLNV